VIDNISLTDLLIQRYPVLANALDSINALAGLMLSTALSGGTIFTCGNGGSASDADHIAGELVKGFLLPRPLGGDLRKLISSAVASGMIDPGAAARLVKDLQTPVRALSLCSNQALLTAIMNDQGPDMVFAQQLLSQCKDGDLLICLSTSGRSPNVLAAATLAKILGAQVAALTGPGDCPLDEHCSVVVHAPGTDAGQIQDLHRPIYHALCAFVEKSLFGQA
jgi:D-sedoheptulose 7-phosphate isomerase